MRKFATIFVALILTTCTALAQGPPPPPLTQQELVDVLKSKQQADQAEAIVAQRGVNFELTPEIEKQLRKAKADDAVIEAVRKAGPSARAEKAAAEGAVEASPEEILAMQAVQNELNPDVAIELSRDFEKNYPNSSLLTYVLALSAAAHNMKGDIDGVIAQCEKSLKLKNDNLMTLLMIAPLLPQPQSLRTGNEDEKLQRAENYAKQALQLVGQITQQPTESPGQFAARKSYYQRDLHSALGMVHMQRAMQSLGDPDPGELQRSEEEYRTAVTISSDPTATDYFRLGEVLENLKKIDPAIEAFTRASQLAAGTVIKKIADDRIAELQKAKGLAPAKP